MKSYRLINTICFTILCTIFINGKSFAEPTNINTVRHELRKYYDSGEYMNEIATVAKEADKYISDEAAENQNNTNPKKLAVVLDIDETSLSYYQNFSKRQFHYHPKAAKEEILTSNAPAIKPILNLYQNAVKNKVDVFFVTARRSYAHQATKRNLKVAGYTNYTGLYTRPASYKKQSIKAFKSDIRAKLEAQGYTIIASIGDQISDLEGGHAQKTFKIPNPFYYIS